MPTALPPGVAPDDLDAMFAAAGEGAVVVAYSGGGDSSALLHMLAERAPSRLSAAIVDHGVREGSARDAVWAGDYARGLGVEAQVLTLSGVTVTQAALRAARYDALCAFARERGAQVIALAHTIDDQAETVLLRQRAGSTWRGLAGMAALAPAPLWPEGRGLLVARPLLNVRRAALRDWLRARGAAWLDDPSNENARFARVRVRRELAGQCGAVERLAAEAAAYRERADAEDQAAAAYLAAAFEIEGPNASQIAEPPAEDSVRMRALTALLAAVGGQEWLPREEAVRRMLAAKGRVTLAGCVAKNANGMLSLVMREPGRAGRRGEAAAPALDLAPGQSGVWDRRLLVQAGAAPLWVNAGAALDPPHSWLLKERLSHILFTPP